MPLGILNPKGVEHVPGTTRYFDSPDRPQIDVDGHSGLKVDRSGKQPIILIPQPSDDPNDPLNWPLWKRDLITFTLSFAAILATALGPILAANTLTISGLFGITLTKAALLTGYFLLGAGAAATFFVPSGRIWGKRHLFIVGICLIIASSAWAGATGKNYGSLAAARAVQGIGAAPFESLLNAAVGDLYFVHQRGSRMAFTNLAVFGGAFFTPILVGKITRSMGWWWTFYFVSIFMAATLPAVFLLCPETTYRREQKLNTDTTGEDQALADESKNGQSSMEQMLEVPEDRQRGFVIFPRSSALQPIGNSATPKKSFVESLSLFDGRKTNERYWVLLLRPFPLLANPAFIWGCLIQGTMIGWTVLIGVILAAIFIGPPYLWREVEAGYAYTGPFIGALIGYLISGLLADPLAKWLTRRNNGIYEPEFRILLVIPMLIIGCTGLFGFGLTAGLVITKQYTFWVPLTFFALEVAGMVIGAVSSSLYIVDAYRDLTIEGFTIMIIFKNIFSFGLTFSAYDWVIANNGIRKVMVAAAIVQVIVCLLSVPMYIYGKKVRAFYHRNDLLAMTGLR
ncbi:unnamed protein product [Clonostachys chloroleuca]|uniref:Major facilitator superfamily (MFS) profile domain-containing protein n=1 Tax=Clonostachys chloroleuca TaxID=1926264 RepID=A0AA35Q6L2_9HYPO|nr:unnamed protein product [Clonostachys chloroleuca]